MQIQKLGARAVNREAAAAATLTQLLRKHGFRCPAGMDDDGWSPLHHAAQATLRDLSAIEIIHSLVNVLITERISAKTTAGRPIGWKALHMWPMA